MLIITARWSVMLSAANNMTSALSGSLHFDSQSSIEESCSTWSHLTFDISLFLLSQGPSFETHLAKVQSNTLWAVTVSCALRH